MISLKDFVLISCTISLNVDAFLAPPQRLPEHRYSHAIFSNTNKGFGKPKVPVEPKPNTEPTKNFVTESQLVESAAVKPLLKSVETGGSNTIPMEDTESARERAQSILKSKYGLKPVKEQKVEDAAKERLEKQQELRSKAESEPDFDIMTALPAPLLIAIDRFLKGGVVICGTLFIIAGLLITVEAWSKTSGQPLPADLDDFIVSVVEPNFTPGLLVLLSFSVGLGLFAAAQLGSSGASYKEE